MKNITKNITSLILILGILVSLWFLMNNIQSIKAMLVVTFIVFVLVFVKLFLPKLSGILKQKIFKIINHRYFVIIFIATTILIGIIARLTFFWMYSYSPVSDPASFLHQAQSIAEGIGLVGNRYVAFFPYLVAYDNILGFAIKIISNSWLVTIILNTIFDLAAAIITALLIKKISHKTSKKYLIAFALWFLSPFNIIFSVISLPIIIVNFFIILAIFLTHLLIQKILTKNMFYSIAFSVILGMALGYGNCFRPIFSIFIIAIFLYLIYIFVINEYSRKVLMLSGLSLIILVAIFFGIQKLNVAFISSQTGLNVPSDASGWSIYVGSNDEYVGGWNIDDDTYLYSILANNTNYQQVHVHLSHEGIERYKSLGLFGTINLMLKKLSSFAGSQGSVYDAEASIVGYQGSMMALLLGVYILVFIFFVFSMALRYLYLLAKNIVTSDKTNPIAVFITILLLGLFFSSIFVEVQLRYAQVVYPMFIVLATMSLRLNQSS